MQRKLNDRNVGLGKGQEERHEDAVIEAALGILVRGEAAVAQEVADMLREIGCAGRRIGQAIGVFREAVIIEQERRMRIRLDRRHRRLPMARDDHDGLGPRLQAGFDGLEMGREPVPHVLGAVDGLHEEAGSAPVGDVKRWHPGHVGHASIIERRGQAIRLNHQSDRNAPIRTRNAAKAANPAVISVFLVSSTNSDFRDW